MTLQATLPADPEDQCVAPPDVAPKRKRRRHECPVFTPAYRALVAEFRKRRQDLGLSQEDLNAAMGMTDGYINKLESFARHPKWNTIELWAKALGFSFALRLCDNVKETEHDGSAIDPQR